MTCPGQEESVPRIKVNTNDMVENCRENTVLFCSTDVFVLAIYISLLCEVNTWKPFGLHLEYGKIEIDSRSCYGCNN